MFYRIFYTSWPQLLEPGRGGFGVVARHKQIPVLVAHAAEAASQFAHLRGVAMHRVVYAYRTETTQSGRWHILSRIEDSGSDYSGRTNYLAQHLVADDSTAHQLAAKGISPARVMMDETAWPGFDKTVGFIEAPAWSPSHLPHSGGYWMQVFDHEENRRYSLAIGPGNVAFAYPADWVGGEWASFVLGLLDEAACCTEPGCRPMCGWGTTFTTYLEPTDKLQDFTWIALPENSSLLSDLRTAGNRPVYDQHSSVPAKPAHPQVPTATANRKAPESTEGQALGRVVVSGQDRSSPLPPFGQPRPPTPQRIGGGISEQSGPPFPRWIIPAALIGMFVAAVVGYAAWLTFFATPDIQFKPETLSHVFDGNPKSAEFSSSPEGATVLYKDGAGWSSSKPSNAGSYRLRVEFPPTLGGWWKPSPIELTNAVLRIEKAQVSIEIPDNQEFPYTKGQERPIVPTVRPEAASAEVKVLYKLKSVPEDPWTNGPRENAGKYLVKAEIDSTSRNYKAVTIQANYQIKEPEPERKALDPLQVGQSKGTESSTSPQGISPALAESTKFEKGIWLANEKAMMGVLTNMPAKGNLYVYTSEDCKWSEIDRGKGKATGDWKAPTMFKMENKVPVRKERGTGPLVYMVGPSQGEPAFVAIEFETGKTTGSGKSSDLSAKLDLFFKETRLENIDGKPCVRFFLKDNSGCIGLEKFRTTLSGERFIFEYARGLGGYSEDKPLEVVLASNGEIAELDALVKAAAKQAAASSVQVTNQDYFTLAKETFLAPLAERAGNTNTNNANPIAQQLYPVLKKLTPPAAADGVANKDVSKKSLAEVNHIIVETLVALTKDPTAYGLIDLTPDRRSRKSQNEQSGSGSFDPSLLDPAELNVESLKNKNIQGVVDRAKKWIDGREGDIHSNAFKEEEKKRAKLLKLVLDDLRKGLNNLKEIGPQRVAVAPPDRGTAERERKAAEAKLAFLTKLQDGGPFDNEQGRLLLCIPANGTAPAVEYILWPNVSLKSASQ